MRNPLRTKEIRRILPKQFTLQSSEASPGEIKKLLDSSDGSSQKKYCGTAPANREAVSINTAQLHIEININGKKRSIIIDLDIIGNFMTQKYTESKKHSIRNKKQFYGLVSLDGTLLRNNSE